MDSAEFHPKAGFPPQEYFSIMNFVREVDWTEPWLIALVVFHAAVTVLTLITRNHGTVQAGLFLILLILVYSSETLNELGARNWRYFSRHQYFDSRGIFISLFFSVPLLLNCLVMVGQWLWTSGRLMIKLKTDQLRKEIRAQRARNASTSGSHNSTPKSRPHKKDQ